MNARWPYATMQVGSKIITRYATVEEAREAQRYAHTVGQWKKFKFKTRKYVNNIVMIKRIE